MSKRKRESSDSLDLLLDTICNTFGGILFLALLVIIMLNMTSKSQSDLSPPSPHAEQQLVVAQEAVKHTEEELKILNVALQQKQNIEKLVNDPRVSKMFAGITQEQAKIARDLGRQQKNLNESLKNQQRINEIAKELAAVEKAKQAVTIKLVQSRELLQKELSQRERSLSLPRQRQTTKEPFGYFMKAGRLIAINMIGGNGKAVMNPMECEQLNDAQGAYLAPKPNAGIVINPRDASSEEALTQSFTKIHADRYFVTIFVWPDSYDHFFQVRQIFVRQQIEYQLIPMPTSEKVRIGNMANRMVQ